MMWGIPNIKMRLDGKTITMDCPEELPPELFFYIQEKLMGAFYGEPIHDAITYKLEAYVHNIFQQLISAGYIMKLNKWVVVKPIIKWVQV